MSFSAKNERVAGGRVCQQYALDEALASSPSEKGRVFLPYRVGSKKPPSGCSAVCADEMFWGVPSATLVDAESYRERLVCGYILHSLAGRGFEEDYCSYIEAGADEDIAAFFTAGRRDPVLGDDSFKQRLQVSISAVDLPDPKQVGVRPTVEQIVGSCARHFGVDEHNIRMPRRGSLLEESGPCHGDVFVSG